MTAPAKSDTHVLYRFYDATGQLLYVGITMSPPRRFRAHAKSRGWWVRVKGITVETYDTRDELESAERRAIRIERPQYNIVHNGETARTRPNESPRGERLERTTQPSLAPDSREVSARLVQSIADVWPDNASFVPTCVLIPLLVESLPDEWGPGSPFGRPITAQRMGRMLATNYGLMTVRPHTRGPRGYALRHVNAALDRANSEGVRS